MDSLKEKALSVLRSFDPKLGTTKELKSTSKEPYRKDLIVKLVELFEQEDVKTLIDISDEKFIIAHNIVDYCIYPYYLPQGMHNRSEKIFIANTLYNNITEENLLEFIEICNLDSEFIEERLLRYIENLKIKYSGYENVMDKVIDIIKNRNKYQLNIENLLPLPDFTNKGKKVCLLPNITAFTNIVNLIANNPRYKGNVLNIYHDQQLQFSESIDNWHNFMDCYKCDNLKTLSFQDSKSDVFIQIADYITGYVFRLYKTIIKNSYVNRNLRNQLIEIKPLLANCNIVSSKSNQDTFFRNAKIKYAQTPVYK